MYVCWDAEAGMKTPVLILAGTRSAPLQTRGARLPLHVVSVRRPQRYYTHPLLETLMAVVVFPPPAVGAIHTNWREMNHL